MNKKTLCSAALVALLGASVIGATNASAALDHSTDGKVEFKEFDGPNPPIDPEEEDKEIVTPPNPNPQPGALKLDHIYPLDFKVQGAKSTDQTYYAVQNDVEQIQDDGSTVAVKRGHFLQLTDMRLDSRTSWTLQAKLDQQFTAAGGNVLKGAKLTYTNGFVNSKAPQAIWPTVTNGGSTSSFELLEDKTAVTVLTSNGSNTQGTYTLDFGNTAGFAIANESGAGNYFTGTADDSTGVPNAADANQIDGGSVQLFVPGGAVKTKEVYTAKILWEIIKGAP